MFALLVRVLQRSTPSRVLITLACLLPVACGGSPPGSSKSNTSANTAAIPRRIISLSPNVTEILEGVGALERVVAVCDYCTYPPTVQRLPRVGGWQNTNLEQVDALQPDLVVMTAPQAVFVDDRLKALGLCTLVVRGQSLEDIFAAIGEIGRAVGSPSQAEALRQRTVDTLEEVRSKTQALPKPAVLCIVDRVPGTLRDLYTATGGSFLDQIIGIAGGKSVAPPAGAGYGKISKEAVVTLNPEVVIDMVQGAQGRLAENPAAVWRELSEIRAVRNHQIYPVKDVLVLHPSQFVADTARCFARIIHPEVFGRGF